MTALINLAAWGDDHRSIVTSWFTGIIGNDDAPWDEVYLTFCYETADFDNAVEDLVSAALGHSGLEPALFGLGDCTGYLDLVAGGDHIIEGVRYILSTPTSGPLNGVDLCSSYVDVKNAIDDRSAVGLDAAVSVLMAAGREYHILYANYLRIIAALTPKPRRVRPSRGDVPMGRPKLLDEARVERARALLDAGHPVGHVCTMLAVSRATLYRGLAAFPGVDDATLPTTNNTPTNNNPTKKD